MIFYGNFIRKFSVLLRVKQRQTNRESLIEADQKNIPKESTHGLRAQYKSKEAYTSMDPLSSTVDQKEKCEEKQLQKLHEKSQTQREKKPKCSERFDGYQHWPEYDDPNESRKGYRCKFCGKASDVYCVKCGVHLCFVKERAKPGKKQREVRNCFKAFHNLEES